MSHLLGVDNNISMFQNLRVKTDTNAIAFETHNIEPSIVSAVRRTIITDIPVVGFRGEDHPSMEILKNNGPLHNEILLHRVGLIPIHFTEEEVESFGADDYEFELKVDNTTNTILNVTTKDIQVLRNGKELSSKDTLRLFPANPISKQHILITRLRKGESIHMKGKAVLETARSHAGFSPGFCTAFPIMDPVLSMNATNILDKERAYARNEHGDATTFDVTIESECGLKPKYLVLKAIEILKSKINHFMQEMYQDLSEKVVIREWTNDAKTGYTFEVKDEDDTLGYLIQSHMHHNYVRMKKLTENGKSIDYVGYVCPHPLESVMHLRVIFTEESAQKSEYIEAVAEQCRRIVADLHAIEADWLRFYTQ
jgi:DNA-directed RNA polymerase subunit L